MMTKHGYEDVSVKDIRKELMSLGVKDEDLLSQRKKPLVELLTKTKNKYVLPPDEDDDLLYNIEFSDDEDGNIIVKNGLNGLCLSLQTKSLRMVLQPVMA